MNYLEICRKQLPIDEGRRAHAYQDSLGFWTIGIGRLIDERRGGRLSDGEIALLFANDLNHAESTARRIVPTFDQLSDARKAVIVNMAFQMGSKLGKFSKTLNAIAAGDFTLASVEMLNSLWSVQTPGRAKRLAEQMREG